MMHPTALSDSAIEHQLQRLDHNGFEHSGCGRWRLRTHGGGALLDLRSDEGWLLLEAQPPATAGKADPWRLACLNRELHGTAKFVLPPHGWEPCLRAEVPLEGDVDAAQMLSGAITGIARACLALAGSDEEALPDPSEVGTTVEHREDIAQLCQIAGWTVRPKNDRVWTTTLACTRGFHQATIQDDGSGGVHLRTEILRCALPTGPCRLGLSTLLLTASGSFRMVRAFAQPIEDSIIAGFEVRLPRDCSSTELGHALAALSVAGEFSSAEISLIAESETVAREYLDVRGAPTETSTTQGGE